MRDKTLASQVRKNPMTWVCISAGTVAALVLLNRMSDSKAPSRIRAKADMLPWSGSLSEHDYINHAHAQAEKLGHRGVSLAEEAVQGARQLKAGIGNAATAVGSQLPDPRHRTILSAVSKHEGALAAFAASLLANGVSGYLQWRDSARVQALKTRTAKPQHVPDAGDLEHLTVVDLRKLAAEQEIDGRSTMNKDELLSALNK